MIKVFRHIVNSVTMLSLKNTENKKTIDSLSKRIATTEKQQENIKSKQ